jgi:acyl carrier protein
MLNEDVVTDWIMGFLMSLLNLGPSEISAESRFYNLGLDSVDAVVMAGAMEEHFKTQIDATIFLRNSTLAELLADLKVNGIVS